MPPKPPSRIYCETPTPGAQGVNIDAAKYTAMRRALLRALPARGPGVPFQGLKQLVAPLLPEATFAGASISWYVTVVKLDLEAKGLIERLPGSGPQRLRRTRG